MDEVHAWKCRKKGGHVLGQVMRDGSGKQRLLLYRQAIREGEGEVEVMAVVDGHVMDIKCSVCGHVRTWMPGEESLNRLINSVMKMRKNPK